MNKALDAVFLLSIFILLCFVCPLSYKKQMTEQTLENHYSYESDYLAWEIKTFKKIDRSVLPSNEIEFFCYDKYMHEVARLTSTDELDFSPYFCVVFTYCSEKRGVYIEPD